MLTMTSTFAENRDIHQTIPDHRVKLTQEGWEQAYEAGRRLRAMLRPEDTLHFFTSPYRRTRETTEGILATLTSDEEDPSPFKRNNIKVYEEPRLREQDFGNFQPCSAEMERMWQERADYGHFFYRIPNGESAADAYDRISGFNESLWRQFGEDDFPSVCVLGMLPLTLLERGRDADLCVIVTHGLMSRVFLMKWYHFSVEYFEDLRNINHCEFLIMNRQDSGKYVLENKLRTWSELRREKAAVAAKEESEGKANGTNKDGQKLKKTNLSPLVLSSPIEARRRWGGCPNGCNHDKSFKIRPGLADLVKIDHKAAASCNTVAPSLGEALDCSDRAASPVNLNPSFNGNGNATPTLAGRRPATKRFVAQNADAESPEQAGPRIDVDKARDNVVSSPDGTPSFISVEDRLRNHIRSPQGEHHHHSHYADRLLHKGRDGGGTYSGHNSVAASDADSSEDERHRRRRVAAASRPKTATTPADDGNDSHHDADDEKNDPSRHRGSLLRPKANRLGDVPHSSDGEHEHDGDEEADDEPEPDDELTPQENHEQSVQGSVY
jgi:broad specificity phosphatase PhoE